MLVALESSIYPYTKNAPRLMMLKSIFLRITPTPILLRLAITKFQASQNPGSSVQIGSTECFITTNICNPFVKISLNKDALIKRFLQISFDKPYHPHISYFNYENQNYFLHLLFQQIANKYQSNFELNIISKKHNNSLSKVEKKLRGSIRIIRYLR